MVRPRPRAPGILMGRAARKRRPFPLPRPPRASLCLKQKKAAFHKGKLLFRWQPKKDSNPHKQSQSLSCYLYTIRLSMFASQTDRKYYTIGFAAKSSFYPNFFHFFRPVRRGGRRRGIGRGFSVHTTIPAASADAGPARLPIPRHKRCVTARKSQILIVLCLYIALFFMIKQVENPLKKQYNNICTKIFR